MRRAGGLTPARGRAAAGGLLDHVPVTCARTPLRVCPEADTIDRSQLHILFVFSVLSSKSQPAEMSVPQKTEIDRAIEEMLVHVHTIR